jgi:hypothetical protein
MHKRGHAQGGHDEVVHRASGALGDQGLHIAAKICGLIARERPAGRPRDHRLRAYSQPLRLKYIHGSSAENTISASAKG